MGKSSKRSRGHNAQSKRSGSGHTARSPADAHAANGQALHPIAIDPPAAKRSNQELDQIGGYSLRGQCPDCQGRARRTVKNTPFGSFPLPCPPPADSYILFMHNSIAGDPYGTTIARQKAEFGLLPPTESPLALQRSHVIDSSLKARTGSFVLMCLP